MTKKNVPWLSWYTQVGCTAVILSLFQTGTLMPSAHAQYSVNNVTNVIDDVTNEWVGNYVVGSNTVGDVLIVKNGGVLSDNSGLVGFVKGSVANRVVVSGKGSTWKCGDCVVVGYRGGGNSLVIEDGGLVLSSVC